MRKSGDQPFEGSGACLNPEQTKKSRENEKANEAREHNDGNDFTGSRLPGSIAKRALLFRSLPWLGFILGFYYQEQRPLDAFAKDDRKRRSEERVEENYRGRMMEKERHHGSGAS